MTQEDKELLLKDLCTRSPYGVKIHINSHIEEQNHMRLFDVNLEAETIGVRNEKWVFRAIPIIDDEDETKVIKPYLRPMESMTDEERKIYKSFFSIGEYSCGGSLYGKEYEYIDSDSDDIVQCISLIDWLNAHHFDYRGLIEKGLAIEVTEENNPYEK